MHARVERIICVYCGRRRSKWRKRRRARTRRMEMLQRLVPLSCSGGGSGVFSRQTMTGPRRKWISSIRSEASLFYLFIVILLSNEAHRHCLAQTCLRLSRCTGERLQPLLVALPTSAFSVSIARIPRQVRCSYFEGRVADFFFYSAKKDKAATIEESPIRLDHGARTSALFLF